MNKIFEPRAPLKVKDLSEINIEELLKETFTMTIIQTDTRNKDGTQNAVSENTLICFPNFFIIFFSVLPNSESNIIVKGPSRTTNYSSFDVPTV